MARRPLEREQVYLDGGRRTTQLMRDSLGGSVEVILKRPIRLDLILLGCLAIVTGCEGGTRLRRTVKDKSGRPIQGATVSLAALYGHGKVDADTVLTQSNGLFDVSLIHSPFKDQPLRLAVERNGFRPFVVRFTAGDTSAIPSAIVLERAP